jgi:hypothetical protein
MFSIWFRVPSTGKTLELKVDDHVQAQVTWDLLSKNFHMVNARP